jgi:hypothetical protein
LSEGKSDATLTNDANFVVDKLRRTSNNGVSLADEIVNDNDQESAKQHLLTLFDEEEHNALPGFHNLFSNMESGDMEVVAEKAAAILFSND